MLLHYKSFRVFRIKNYMKLLIDFVYLYICNALITGQCTALSCYKNAMPIAEIGQNGAISLYGY